MSETKNLDPRVESLAIPLAHDYAMKNFSDGKGGLKSAFRKSDGNDPHLLDAEGNKIQGSRYRDLAKDCETVEEAAQKIAAYRKLDPEEVKRNLIDISRQPYNEFSDYWKAANRGGAEFLIHLLDEKGIDYIKNPENREVLGHAIHEAWLERESWAQSDPVLGRPFNELPPDEQKKDLDQLDVLIAWHDKELEHSKNRQNPAQEYLQRMLDEAEKASMSQQTTRRLAF